MSVEVARGTVSLAARPGFEAGLPETPFLPDTSFDVPSISPTFDLPGTVAPAPVGPGGQRPVGTDVPIPEGAGIGSLVLLALLAVPFIGDRLGALAFAVLTADHTDPCDWEEP